MNIYSTCVLAVALFVLCMTVGYRKVGKAANFREKFRRFCDSFFWSALFAFVFWGFYKNVAYIVYVVQEAYK